MTSSPITDAGIRTALAARSIGRHELTHPDEQGLILRIGKQATWSLQVRVDGVRRRLTLGDWPELSVDRAVEECRRRRILTAQPSRLEAETVEAIFVQYERFKGPQLKRQKGTLRSLSQALETIRFRDPLTITRQDIASIVNRKSLTAPSHANRQLAYMKAFFNWAVAQGLMSQNPAKNVPKPAREITRERVLRLDELASIWREVENRPGPYSYVVRLLILTACRLEEVAHMRVSELILPDDSDEGEWVLPASRTKNNQAIRIPLAPPARRLLEEAIPVAWGDLLFSTNGDTPFSGWSKAKSALDRRLSAEGVKLPHWVHHDFRRSFATVAAEQLDIRFEVADACLNHMKSASRSQVGQVYNRSHLFPQRRVALQRWAALVMDEVEREDADSNKSCPSLRSPT